MPASARRFEGVCPGCGYTGPQRRSCAAAERDLERHAATCGPPPGSRPQALPDPSGETRPCVGCGEVLPLEAFFFLPTVAGEPVPSSRCMGRCLNVYVRVRDQDGARFVRLDP